MAKGNAIIGQSGGPTAVINSSLAGAIAECKQHGEVGDVYGMRNGVQGLLAEKIVDLGRQPRAILDGLRRTPSAALGSCRYKLNNAEYEQIVRILRAHNVRYLFYCGGNDSADTCMKIAALAAETGFELQAIAIPKTVDNDLVETDHCPGYGSVARFIATATMDAGRDTEAIGVVDTVKVIEAMGRNAGWITAAAALGKRDEIDAPHLIYVPERPIVIDRMLSDVQKVYDRLGHVVIVVCEGAKGEDGKPLSASTRGIDVDSFGHAQLGGAADVLCKVISSRLNLKARYDKPGTIQRMSQALVSRSDEAEAFMAGQAAVRAAMRGEHGKMVTLVREPGKEYHCTTGLVDLTKVANAERLMPDDFISPDGNFVTQKYVDYAMPLVGDPLPEYVRLKDIPAPKAGA